MGEKYRMEVVCSNCPFDGIVHLDEDEELENIECPRCDEKELMEPKVSFD